MALKKKTALAAGLAVAGLATAGVVTFGGNAFAEDTPSPTPSSSSTTNTKGQQDGQRGGDHGASQDTAVTGDEAQKVIDAVQAKNSGTKITEVRKDPDGSYDAVGTKADGSRVMYDVSKDLATITEAQGGGGKGGHGGGSQDAAVTGDEAQKVIDAVQAKNSGTKITEVRKDPDGSYDAVGTKADGSRVMYDVSKDLKTITEAQAPAGR